MSRARYVASMALGGVSVLGVLVATGPHGFLAGAADEKHGGDIVFEVGKNKQELVHSIFSHQAHLDAGHTCKDCHNDTVFSRERELGVNKFTMKDVMEGKACGACHDGRTTVKGKTVFAPQKNCTRCHSVKFRKKSRR